MLYAWRGPSLLVVGNDGRADPSTPLHGFYHREARFLRELAITINGHQPWLCECASVQPDRLSFNYVYPEITSPGGGGTGQSDDQEHLSVDGLPERALDLDLTYHVTVTSLDVRLAVTNRSRRHVDARVRCALDADFADLLEAQSGQREQEAPVTRRTTAVGIAFSYSDPELPYRGEIAIHEGWSVADGNLSAHVSLDSQQTVSLNFELRPHSGAEDFDDEGRAARERTASRWSEAFTTIEIPGNRIAERVVRNSARDIASLPALTGAADEWLSLQAGMPLYPAFFGRDAVTAGWQAALLDRSASLDSAMTRLGRMQATKDDSWSDAEPGRLPYQMRTGPLARLGRNPYRAYYADYASPLMFVIALANLFSWTGDTGRLRAHWDTARRIMDWARERGDLDGDGYLEYQTRSPKGTKNQGWKDSGDAIVYDDGSPVPSPIATCELQGYWYVAQELMAVLSGFLNDPDNVTAFHHSAAALKERFNRDWWVDEEQFFALALDPDKQPVRAVTSNVGHCVATGIVDHDHLRAVVGRMFAPDMFSGWGIRTLSSRHGYYDPLSYHRGTVWGVEQGTIVFGLRRFGFDARAQELALAQFELAGLYPGDRVPECIGGYARGERPTPGAYPRANTPQLWNATAFILILQSLLGIVPLAQVGTLVIDPQLPEWMPDVVLRGLRVGEARVTLAFRRKANGQTDWDVVHQQGQLRVIRQSPPESITAGVGDRISGLLESYLRA